MASSRLENQEVCPMGKDLRDAVVVLTGASSGIGAAAAIAFAKKGARLVLSARNRRSLRQVAQECERAGADVIVVVADVGEAAAMKKVASTASKHWNGRIDVWINNAGVGAVGPFTETPIEAHD